MEVIDATEIKKKKTIWKYDKFVEAIKKVARNKEELGLKIEMNEIMQYLIDKNRKIRRSTIRAFIKTAAKRAGFKLEACYIKNDTVFVLLKANEVRENDRSQTTFSEIC